MCEHTFPLYSIAVVAIRACMHYFYCGEKPSINQLVYLFVEANLKPVADARETAAFPATCLCLLIGLSSHSSTIYLKIYRGGHYLT